MTAVRRPIYCSRRSFQWSLTSLRLSSGPLVAAVMIMLVLRLAGNTLSRRMRSRKVLVSQYACSMPTLGLLELLQHWEIVNSLFEIIFKFAFYLLY